MATGEVLNTRFNSNRLRLIFDVNTRSAYAAGQWQRFEAGKRTNPYLRYVTKRDERVRDSHKALNNLVLPVDHPFWDTHAPPNGWRCRCSLTSMSQKDYDKGLSPRGDPLNKTAPEVKYRDWYNAKTGKTERVPVGVDPGWGYNPGKVKARDAAMRTMVDDKIAKLEPGLARKVQEDLAAFARSKIQVDDGVDDDFSQAVMRGYDLIPESWRSVVANAGHTVVVTQQLTDVLPRLKGVTPQGYDPSLTWDNVDGGFFSKEHKLIVAQASMVGDKLKPVPIDRGLGLLYHEFGHALDFSLVMGLSTDVSVVNAWRAEAEELRRLRFKSQDERNDRDYFTQAEPHGIRETVAELIARIHDHRTAESIDALNHFKQTLKALRNRLSKV